MSQIYNGKKNQLGILGISARKFTYFDGNSAEVLGSRKEHYWSYISMTIHSKSWCIFTLKVATTLHSGSRKCTVGA